MAALGYEEIDHTADLALRVTADDFYALLIYSARGMYDLMGIDKDNDYRIETTFTIPEGTEETTLVDFLSELLYRAEDKAQVFDEFSFKNSSEGLKVEATGNTIKHISRNIKAVTFHDLDILKTNSGLEATITFDV